MSWKPWFSSQKPWKASCAPLSVRSHKSRDYDIKAWCYFNQSNNTISFNLYSSYFHLKRPPLNDPKWPSNGPSLTEKRPNFLENGSSSNKLYFFRWKNAIFAWVYLFIFFFFPFVYHISCESISYTRLIMIFLFKISRTKAKKKR